MTSCPLWTLGRAVPGLAAALLILAPGAAQGLAGPTQDGPVFSLRQASAPGELELTFEEAAVLAAGLTPGGDAVFWSVAREPQGHYQKVVRRQGLAAVDALGQVRFEPDGAAVPLKSVWAVVDVGSGAFAVGAPPEFALEEVPFPGQGFEVGAPGLVNRFRHELEAVEQLLVRPGVGAWVLRAFDQGPEDRDETDDDRVLTSLEDFVPLDAGGPDPPERFARDDVFVVVDPRSLRVFATRLLGAPVPGGGGE
ncbi:MAG TPA: hypothetical protein VLF66_11655 [Thermoanaerobaculia bacterium]|nr:hypothetical protein [Thermoanaerobaculia bacterium]